MLSSPRVALVLFCLLAACDCGGPPGDACLDTSDCPVGLECVVGAGNQRICVRPRDEPDASMEDPDADASTPYFCDEIQPILARTCVSSCHGADQSGSKDVSFRLDVYEQADGGAGAKARAARVKARMTDLQTMPPFGEPQPTADERRRVGVWVKRGAPSCADAGL